MRCKKGTDGSIVEVTWTPFSPNCSKLNATCSSGQAAFLPAITVCTQYKNKERNIAERPTPIIGSITVDNDTPAFNETVTFTFVRATGTNSSVTYVLKKDGVTIDGPQSSNVFEYVVEDGDFVFTIIPSNLAGAGTCNNSIQITVSIIEALLTYSPSMMQLGNINLFQDTAGTIPAANTELVGLWNDSTTNNKDLTQSVSGNRPTRSGFGVKFPSGKSLSLPASVFSTATTIIAVFEAAAISDYHVICGGDSGLGLLVDAGRYFAVYIMGSSPITTSVDKVYGTQMLSVVLHASADKMFFGDTECTYLPRGGSIAQSRATATVGNNPANQFPMLNNVLHALLIFSTALTSDQIGEIHTLIQSYFSNISGLNTRLVLDGNSLMAEDLDSLSQVPEEEDRLPYKLLAQLENVDAVNTALGGQAIGSLMSDIHPYYSIFRPANVCTVWEITNDLADSNISAATAYSHVVTQCTNLQRYGWKVVVGTCLPRSAVATFFTEEKRLAVNALIRANWETFADALADVGADPDIGAFGANDGPHYIGDSVHLGATGNDIAAGIFKTALNSIGVT